MTTPTISTNAGSIAAGGNVGDVNSHNTIYYWHPGQQRVELADWISSLSFSQYQSQAFERYTKGTLLWVLKDRKFVAWLSDGGMLWAYAQPGAGKTVFASFIIHYLQKLSLYPKPAVCYIYHRYDTTRSTLQLFEAMLRQLILNCPCMNIHRIQAAKDQDQRLTLSEILLILQETFDHVPNIFLVIDAFDECFDEATRHQVLCHLESFSSVKTLITSRPLPSIESAIRAAQVLRLIISARAEDIKTHFRAQETVNRTLAKLVSKVSHTDIEGKLIEKADGRFLLAGLHITNLAAQTNITKLLRALETLPEEATATYEQTLDRIRRQTSNHRQLAFHTLSWVLHALRPLTVIELRHALAIGDLDRMAGEQDLDDEEFILSSSAGLVIVNKESQTVAFLHYTVQEFLQQAQTAPDFLSDLEITLRCMGVISFHGITSDPPNYPLIKYAASAWGPLVRRHEQDKTVFELAFSQLGQPVTVEILSSAKIDAGLQSYSGRYEGRCGATAIHLIAVYGLSSMMEAFIAGTSTTVNEKDREGCTALIWAVRNGHLEVVRVLLACSTVDVNSLDKVGRTPLSLAAGNGNLDIVKKLLTHSNVNVDSKDRFGRTPLSWAAGNRNLEVLKELLTCSHVDVNSEDQYGRTPLSWAAESENFEVISELLAHPSVNVDSKDRLGRTPLSWAAGKGNLETVKVLLACTNVNVDSKDQFGRTPLSWAAGKGNVEVIKELLACPNVDINSQDRYGQTPFSRAAENGNLEVIKELLTCNANIDLKDQFGRTPLYWATSNMHLQVVRLLTH